MIGVCPFSRIEEVVPVATRFFHYANESGSPSGEHWTAFWKSQYNSRMGVLFIETDANDTIIGFYGLVFFQEPWTGDLVAQEVCWYSEGSEIGRAHV